MRTGRCRNRIAVSNTAHYVFYSRFELPVVSHQTASFLFVNKIFSVILVPDTRILKKQQGKMEILGLDPSMMKYKMEGKFIMTNLRFLKTMIIMIAIFMFAFCEPIKACDEGYVVGITTGKCLESSGECGDGCTYTLDNQGNLHISGDGNGVISQKFRTNRDIKNVVVGEGITKIVRQAFYGAGAGGGTVTLPSSLTRLDTDAFWATRFSTFDVNSSQLTTDLGAFNTDNITLKLPAGENIQLSSHTFGSSNSHTIKNLTLECKGDILVCNQSTLAARKLIYNDGGNSNLYDSEGNSIELQADGFVLKDSKSQILGIYDYSSNIKKSYQYGADGSVAVYDGDGNLSSMTKGSIFTPAEAARATKGTGNTVSITW